MKLDKEIVEGIVKQNVSDNTELIKILAALEQAEAEAVANRAASAGKEKKKFLAVQIENTESVYLLQSKEGFDDQTLVDVIRTQIAPNFNSSKAGIKNPVTQLSEAFEFVANKFYKDFDLAIKTKTPLDIIKTPNHKILTT